MTRYMNILELNTGLFPDAQTGRLLRQMEPACVESDDRHQKNERLKPGSRGNGDPEFRSVDYHLKDLTRMKTLSTTEWGKWLGGVLFLLLAATRTAFAADPLVNVDWVKANLDKPGIVYIDFQPPTDYPARPHPGRGEQQLWQGRLARGTCQRQGARHVAGQARRARRDDRQARHRQRHPRGAGAGRQVVVRHGHGYACVLDLQGARPRQRLHPRRWHGGVGQGQEEESAADQRSQG